MASSVKLLGRIGAALHGGSAPAEANAGIRRLAAQAAEIPEGYALTSSGLLVPWPKRVALKGFDLRVHQLEARLLEKMEKSSSLVYRFTKCVVSTAACGIALRLTWREVTNPTNVQLYLPEAPAHGEQAPAHGYLTKKLIANDVNSEMLLKYNTGWKQSVMLGAPAAFLNTEVLLSEQRRILLKNGFCEHDVEEAQLELMHIIKESTAKHIAARNQLKPEVTGEEKPKVPGEDKPEVSCEKTAASRPTPA